MNDEEKVCVHFLLFTECTFYCIMWHKTISDNKQHERQTIPWIFFFFDLFVCLLFTVVSTHFSIPYCELQIIL